jgi:Bacterial SH3 domain
MAFNPNILSQRDPHWKGEKLGYDNTVTIGTDGCTLTCLTMLVNGYGFNETPDTLNRKLLDLGPGNGFMDGLIVWEGLARAFPKIVYLNNIGCRDKPAPLDSINKSLDSGQPLVVEVDRSSSPGLESHWVILIARQGDDYLILDPWPFPTDSGPVSLAGRYGFGHPLDQVITAVVWYQDSSPSPAPTAPLPNSGLMVCVQASLIAGLRLRSAPNTTTSSTTALEPAGALLRCLEPDAIVLTKIGNTNQWLQVNDPNGASGFVAAWYVNRAGAPPSMPMPQPIPVPMPQPATEPAPQPATSPLLQPSDPIDLTVSVSQSVGISGLRMRKQPYPISATVTVVPAGAELAVLEPLTQALPKIGQQNQWLNVRYKNSNSGFVAAWYIELKPGSAPMPSASSQTAVPSATEVLTVTVSSQVIAGLRLRDQPDPGANTVKILPAGTILTVLEASATARYRIGLEDQWLNVKEPGGQSGYVTAKYVKK